MGLVAVDGAIRLWTSAWPPDVEALGGVMATPVLPAVGVWWLVDMLRGEG